MVYDPTIHTKSIARHIRKSDFAKDNSLYVRANLDAAIAAAVAVGSDGFQNVSISRNLLRGKYVYQLNNISDDLVIRHITSNIRRITSVKQDDRQFIIRCINSILREGVPFRIYKFDIASFYESVSIEDICKQLENDVAFSGQSIRALRTFFSELQANHIDGLPRGMSISATLAEYLLRDVDRFLSGSTGVWFYARFVDDIFVITNGREDPTEFSKRAAKALPGGLQFNKKSLYHAFAAFSGGNATTLEHSFDFLGYRFHVSRAYRDTIDKKIKRNVTLDIAPSKVRKIKTRIAKSLISYRASGDFQLLFDRIKILTSNFNFIDNKTGARRVSGIFFNYPLLNADASAALADLDKFLTHALTVPHAKNRLRPNALTKQERQSLLNLRFIDGFKKKRFFAFKPNRLVAITGGWAYA